MASDGSVTIKIQANDRALKDLVKGVQDLRKQLDNLSSNNPFEAIARSAEQARSALLNMSDTAKNVASSVDTIDSDAVADVGDSADRSETEMDELSATAHKTAQEVDKVDGSSVADVGDSANRADSEVQDMGQSAGKAADEVNKFDPKPIEETEESSNKLNISFLTLMKTVGVIKVISVGFDMIRDSIDGAIDRFDTFNTFPRTMEGLGYSTEQADRALRRLDSGIRGLPTTLDGIVGNVQRIASVTGDLNLAVDTALALNNAFLASGSSAADAQRGTEQYVQMLSKGEADLQSYRTLQETMTLALNQTAEAFGFAGESAQTDLYAALKSGNITFREFNERLIELSNEVGGFADLAQTNSESLRTSWTNLRTAFVRNTANMITKLDELSVALTGRNIAQNVDNLQQVINKSFGAIGSAIDAVSPLIVGTADAFKFLYDVSKPLHPVLSATAVALGTMLILSKVNTLMSSSTIITGAYVIATDLLAGASARAATAKATLSGAVGVWSKVAAVATGVTTGLGTAINLMLGPIGWVTIGIGALVGGFSLLRNMASKTHPELDQMAKELGEATDATTELTDSAKTAAESYESTQARIEGQTNSIRTLMEDTKALAAEENLSSAQKKILKDNIDELNESVEGLNLSYDEEQGRLTGSNEAMEARLSMMDEENNMAAQRERLVEIEQQRDEIEKQITENIEKQHAAEAALAESRETWWGRVKDNLGIGEDLRGQAEENAEANKILEQTYTDLGIEHEQVTQDRIEFSERLAESEKTANNQVITSLTELEDTQQTVAESIRSEYQSLVQQAQNWSSAIETEYTKTNSAGEEYVASSKEVFADAKATLEQNVEAMREWSENMETLSKRGIDEGMLEQLRQMGPEGLPLVEGFVNASDEELAEMEGLFKESAELSKEGLLNGLAIEEGSIIDGAEELIFSTGQTMIEAVSNSGLANIVPDALKESKGAMEEAGHSVADGAAEGIEKGTERALRASENMADGVNDSFRGILGIRSPSTVFTQHGSDIIAGLLQGFERARPSIINAVMKLGMDLNKAFSNSLKEINSSSLSGWNDMSNELQRSFRQMNQVTTSGTRELTQTHERSQRSIRLTVQREQRETTQIIRRSVQDQQNVTRSGYSAMRSTVQANLSSSVAITRSTMSQAVSIMNNVAGQAHSAGRNMGLGFRNGLNSTTGGIMSTARSIANSAANTIRSALRIHSPSKVTESLGEFTGDGLVEGMRNRLRDIEQIAEEMAVRALPRIDVAKSLGSVGGIGSSSAVYNNQSYTLNANSSGVTSLTREDMERLFKEFIWYIKQEGGALDG